MFVRPKWEAEHEHYTIEMTNEYKQNTSKYLLISRDSRGSTVFTKEDDLHNTAHNLINSLIKEGSANKWFSKLPSHEQLMKRTRHTFARLATDTDTMAYLTSILMTPKLLTFVWTPIQVAKSEPPLYFEDSDSEYESDAGTEPELEESALPPVALRDSNQESQEEYLLTRLRAAKARVEAETVRMQYFETTGRMPPDSEDEDEDEEDT